MGLLPRGGRYAAALAVAAASCARWSRASPNDALRAPARRSIDELARILPELAEPGRPAPQGAADEAWSAAHGGKHRMFDAIMRVFTRAAEQRPVRARARRSAPRAIAASLELLRCFVDEIARSHVLLVSRTLRHERGRRAPRRRDAPDLSARPPQLRAHRARAAQRRDVARLRRGACSTIASGTLGRAVFEKSEGNPVLHGRSCRASCATQDRGRSDPRSHCRSRRSSWCASAWRG